MQENEFTPSPPALPPEIVSELQLQGRELEIELAVRGRGGLFEAEGNDLSPVGVVVHVAPPKNGRIEDCFRTGADIRFPYGLFAVRADLVYSVRGIVGRRDRIIAAFRFRRELTPDQCRQLGIPFEPCTTW